MNERLSVPFLPSFRFQLFGYLALAAASLLIVLCMYILRNLAIRPSVAHVYRQHRHMDGERFVIAISAGVWVSCGWIFELLWTF